MSVYMSLAAVVASAILLVYLILKSRGYTGTLWWAYRIFCILALLAFLYLAYDTGVNGYIISPIYLFIRLACLALILAHILGIYLQRKEDDIITQHDFNIRLSNIMKGDSDVKN